MTATFFFHWTWREVSQLAGISRLSQIWLRLFSAKLNEEIEFYTYNEHQYQVKWARVFLALERAEFAEQLALFGVELLGHVGAGEAARALLGRERPQAAELVEHSPAALRRE